MSGRKQHYIPQFVLRAFGESGSGKKVQIRVTTRDRTFVVPTDGAAAQREFYSKLDSDVATLDDVITSAEAEYASIYRDLAQSEADEMVDSEQVARLLTHLASRGNYLRQSLSTFGRYAMQRISQSFSDVEHFKRMVGVGRAEPSAFMRSKFDEMYNEKRDILRKARMSRHDFRKFAFQKLNEKWEEIFNNSLEPIKILPMLINFAELAAEGHQKLLREDIEPAKRVALFAQLDWKVVDFKEPKLALPDCIALSHYPETGVMPAGFVGKDDLTGVIFPLSPTRALCAGTYQHSSLVKALSDQFGMFSALCSWDFVVTPPSYSEDWIPRDRLGSSMINLMVDTMEKAMADHLAEMLT